MVTPDEIPAACPVCAALLLPDATSTHVDWHSHTRTLDGWSSGDVTRFLHEQRQAAVALVGYRGDAAETLRLPPITDTVGVRRRPPVPELRELKGTELLRALADAIDADPETAGDDL